MEYEPCRVSISPEGFGGMLRALRQEPDFPKRFLHALSCEDPSVGLPGPPVHPEFERHYLYLLAGLLAVLQENCRPVPAPPDRWVLASAGCVAFMRAVLVPYPSSSPVRLPGGRPPEFYLDQLAQAMFNVFGEPSPSADSLAELIRNSLSRWGDEDLVQEVTELAYFAAGGPTPQLVEHVVRTGEIPDTALPAVLEAREAYRFWFDSDPADPVQAVRAIYNACAQYWEIGAPLHLMGRALGEVWENPEPLEAMRGKWWWVVLNFAPSCWPPPIATASYFDHKPVQVWLETTKRFLLHRRWRNTKRAKRSRTVDLEGVALGILDPSFECVEGRLVLEELIRRAGLSRREQEVAWLRMDGHTVKEIAEKLGVTPGTVKQILSRLRRKLGSIT